ncbi:M48 family metalloprotease [Allokutzneria oryzae]|uniref:M48 family metalloprotease n=1 Tax=Allokutzneria oryzae TaxID=1378989 RepID=A0ABV5ZXI2_9PSEU
MTAIELVRRRVDERVLGAGTTQRFVLLVVLLVLASGSMALSVASGLSDSDGGGWGCALAAGWDLSHGDDRATMMARLAQPHAYETCIARFAPPPPWWIPLVWPVLLTAAAGVLFLCLSAWKTRRGRVFPLEVDKHDTELRALLEDVVAAAGLTRAPRFVVDPVAASTSAVVFGSNRRPTVCLHGGLLASRHADPERFRAVLLHELAHIRNGDVTITYATVAVWRVFLAMALLPYLATNIYWFAAGLRSPWWSASSPNLTRGLLVTAVMVVLVYLARSDVLRSREVYADLAAERWGADPRGWAVMTAPPAAGAVRRALDSFVELWRTHPRWDLRRDALNDPVVLFEVRALPMFLTGTAAALINNSAWRYLKQYGLTGWWVDQATAFIAAGLVTGVVGIALWRAVAHAVLTSRTVPNGVRAGLWLGFGIVVGELVTGQQVIDDWLPGHSEFFVLVVLAGAVFTWWVTQCAHLWITTWQGRTIRPVMLLGLAAACLVPVSWFAWWLGSGALVVVGWPDLATGMLQMMRRAFPGPADHSAMLSAIAEAIPVVASVTKVPLVLAGVAALWVVPLLAWTIRPGGALPWARRATAGVEEAPGHALPTLWRVLLPGVLGGVLCWVAVAGVQAYMHSWQPDGQGGGGLYSLVYWAWVFVAVVAAPAVAAVVASVLASHYRLLVTLIAAETAAMLGFVGTFVLASVDGCVRPLNTLQSSCGWRPELAQTLFEVLLTPVLVFTAVFAVVAAAVVSVFRKARAPVPAHPPSRKAVIARRLCVGVLCAAAVGVVPPNASQGLSSMGLQQDVRPSGVVDPTSVSVQTRQLQAAAWRRFGGADLLRRFNQDGGRLVALVNQPTSPVDEARVRPVCVALKTTAREANDYFRLPARQAQQRWQTFVMQARMVGQNCEQALSQSNGDLFGASLLWLEAAWTTSRSVDAWLTSVMRDSGQLDTPPATQPRQLSAGAWKAFGGGELVLRYLNTSNSLITYVEQARGRVDVTRLRPLCDTLGKTAQEAGDYFPVRDPEARTHWQTFVAKAQKAGQDCDRALTELDNRLFGTSLNEVEEAATAARAVESRIDAAARAGG